MKNKKIWGSLLLTTALLLSSGCGTKSTDNSQSAATAAPTATTTPAATASPQVNGHGGHWSYEGETGPSKWGELDPAFTACTNGTEQSPINIDIAKVQPNQKLEAIQFNYQPTLFSLMNNGHTVQANPAGGSNTIVVEGKTYKLAQFHFHLPSEHQFNGQNFDMELHLVHKSEAGELAVVGIMLKGDAENKALADLWAKLPKQQTQEDVKLDSPIDLISLLPKDKWTFRYNGSLTTPPCSQSVKWIVMEQPIEVSKVQIDAYRAIFPDDHRPVQDIKGRVVQTDKK